MIKAKIREKLDDVQSVPYEKIINKLSKFDAVSFDIFDTLIKRNVPLPTDVFKLMEKQLGIKNFALIRIEAERKARKRFGEVTLDEIYDEIIEISHESREKIKQQEIEYECNLCVVNKKMMQIYKYAVENKKVYLISDMYLSKEVIKSILEKNGITGYDALVVSNELRKNKTTGELYKYVKEKYMCSTIIHIGNNFIADYIWAQKSDFSAIKIKTSDYRLPRLYKKSKTLEGELLESFLNNAHDENKSFFYNFGYERFGPILFGFTNWLYESLKKDGIEQVLFMSRDGFIMQKIYHTLGYNTDIPDRYFEASRRSLRVPLYCKNDELEDVIKDSPLLSTTNLEQFFDSVGLNIYDYKEIVEKYGYHIDDLIKRDYFYKEKRFKELYEEIHLDIKQNSESEFKEMMNYLENFDFSLKTAIVDIGWGGSMQKNLTITLNQNGIENNIIGYYFGLSSKSKVNLGENGFKARGYLFDCLNDSNSVDTEIAFRPLFETLFLEQKGSVKKYCTTENGTCAVRYPYEYLNDGKLSYEAVAVKEIQEGAIKFAVEFQNSKIKDSIKDNRDLLFKYLYETGTNPTLQDVEILGKFIFFNNGSKNYLANAENILKYIFNPRRGIKDLTDSQWKVGFFKSLLKIPFPYLKLYMRLHRLNNQDE